LFTLTPPNIVLQHNRIRVEKQSCHNLSKLRIHLFSEKDSSGNNNLSVQKNLEDYIKSGDQVYLKII